MSPETLPAVNALLNTTAAILLLFGRRAIKQKKILQHRRIMIAVVAVSAAFLASYLTYHANFGSRPFQGEGLVRIIYFAILLTHTVLAAAIVPMVLVTLKRGLKREDSMHTRIARWTYPVWLYVSVTGIVIYLMLYQLFPAG